MGSRSRNRWRQYYDITYGNDITYGPSSTANSWVTTSNGTGLFAGRVLPEPEPLPPPPVPTALTRLDDRINEVCAIGREVMA